MVCIKQETVGINVNEKRVVLLADASPENLNLTGADVENLPDIMTFASGSYLIVPPEGAIYIKGESSSFDKWGEPKSDPSGEVISGDWGDNATYTWDESTRTLTITQTQEQYTQGPVSGTDVDGYADVVETLVLDHCNVTNFANYGMKYLKYVNSSNEGTAFSFAGCTNLEEVEAGTSCTLSQKPFNGCDNIKKFTISGTVVLSYGGIPTTCVFYGPAMYQEEAESKGYTYVVVES